jgi:hypothetical protein
MRRTARIAQFIVIIQSVLFLVHFFLFRTWTFAYAASPFLLLWLKLLFGFLSISFVSASLLAFRYTNTGVRAFYRLAAVWLGLLTFLFAAALATWLMFGISVFLGLHMSFHHVAELFFAVGSAIGFYGVINASCTRITRATVRLANLPAAWRGRKAALISDLHLGPVRNGNFLRRMVAKILSEGPDAIFIAGDL